MVLRGLQLLLGRLYDVDLRYDVYDFLVTDRRAVAGCGTEEELLLAETLDAGGSTGAGVALYLDPEVLRRLEHADPHRALTEHNLADYCTALETQAEVDKYAVTVFLLARQTGAMVYPAQVHARLFDRVRFDARLEPHEYERYRTAHRCAARYCRRLERRFVNRGVARIEAMVRELRSFYRLRHAAKLRHALA